MAWFVDYEPKERLAHSDGWEDGIVRDMRDLGRDELGLRARTRRVQWLDRVRG